MNSPFAAEQAKHLASRSEIVSCTDDKQRVERMYRLMFGRPASPEEIKLAVEFINRSDNKDDARRRYAHALMLTNEFVFVD